MAIQRSKCLRLKRAFEYYRSWIGQVILLICTCIYRTTLKLSRFGQATGEYAVPVEDIVVKYDAKQNEIRIEYEDGNSEAVFKK